MNNKISMNKLFWGLLFLLAGVSLILNQLDILPTIYHISLWDIVLTLFFIWIFLSGLHHRNFFGILLGLALIAIQYDEPLHITAITPWTLLCAAIFAAIGLTIIFPQKKYHKKGTYHNSMDFEFADNGKKKFDEASGETIYFKNTFSSATKYVNTDALVNISIQNSFGEMKVYFDNAIIKNGVADLNLESSFGEVTLYLPKTWHVENHTQSSFSGGLREENFHQSEGCPTLRIYGEIAFGDAVIVYI